MIALIAMTTMIVTASATSVSSSGTFGELVEEARAPVGDGAGEHEVADGDRVQRGDEHRACGDVLRDLGHRVERGRGDVDGRLDRGVHELGDEHERDREQEHHQLDLRDAEGERRDQDGDGDGEVDPEVPLRPQGVDDALGRVVEALEEGLARLARCHRECSSSRVSISSPCS